MSVLDTHSFYENSYSTEGLDAQRRYPNEELCRFMGRRFFSIPVQNRKAIRILEVGSGSGANLKMIAQEGFDTYGVELSESGNNLCRQMLSQSGLNATLADGSMTDMKFNDGFFDAIVDIFSSYCLDEKDHGAFLSEASRVLKPNGLFFSYTPSKRSDAFKNHSPSRLLDRSTLDGIHRQTSPYAKNLYPFRFEDADDLQQKFTSNGIEVTYVETVGRTYRSRSEYFEFITIEGRRA